MDQPRQRSRRTYQVHSLLYLDDNRVPFLFLEKAKRRPETEVAHEIEGEPRKFVANGGGLTRLHVRLDKIVEHGDVFCDPETVLSESCRT